MILASSILHTCTKIIGLYCKRALEKKQYSATETCNVETCKEPTNRSHLIDIMCNDIYSIHVAHTATPLQNTATHCNRNRHTI